MKDAKFEAEKKRVRRMQDKWYPMMGLKWWRVTYEYVDDAAAMPKTAFEALACAKADWRYMTATITFNLAESVTRDDDLVEFAVVHEGVHVLVSEMAGDGECADDHEKRVCSTIASAFIWTREAGRKDRKKRGKKS